ncbi:MAG TPA: hypothetical protein VF529_05050 [Solirubrobacteraceae bacterium]|jgi:hypothetical protein
MPTLMLMHWPGVTAEEYAAVCERIDFDKAGERGGIAHVAAVDEDGLHVTDVWESAEQFQQFADDTLMPITRELGVGREEPRIRLLPTIGGWARDRVPAT